MSDLSSLDLSLSFEDAKMIKVVLCPIGTISEDKFAEYVETISRFGCVELNQLSRGIIDKFELTPHQDWSNGKIHFTFLKATAAQIQDKDQFRNDFEDLQWHKKITGVIGLLNAQDSKDLNDDYAYFKASVMTAFPSAAVHRCFAFEPRADQPDIDGSSEFVMIPQADPSHLHFYMSTLLADFATGVLTYFQSFLGRVLSKPYIVTPLDDLGEERTLKKRQVGRISKIKGDVCLQAGSPEDALEYYTKAVSEGRSYSDWVWLGCAHEGYCAAYLEVHGLQQADAVITDTLEEALACFAKCKSASLELEACIKLARHHCSLDRRTQANEELMRAFALRTTISGQSSVVLMSSMAQLYHSMKMYRKFAFCMQQLAALYRQLHMNATTERVLLMSARFYQLHEMAPGSQQILTRRGKDVGARHGWLILQAYMLMELANTAILRKDTFAYAQYVTYLLRSLSSTVSAKTQEELSRVLLKVTADLATAVPVNMIGIALVRQVTVHPTVDLVRETSGDPDSPGRGSPSIFLYQPKMAKSRNASDEVPLPPASLWVQGEVSNVSVELENTLEFPVKVQSIQFVVRGAVKCDAFSTRITLKPKSRHTVVLSGVPLSSGAFVITGILVRTFNLMCFHPVDLYGKGISEQEASSIDYDAATRLGATVVSVAPCAPKLQVESILFNGASLEITEGSCQRVPFIIRNSGTLAVDSILFRVEEVGPAPGHHADVSRAFSWRDGNPPQLLREPLLHGQQITLELEVYGLPGRTAAKFLLEYSCAGHRYKRVLERRLRMSVNKGLQVVRLDVVVCDFPVDNLPPSLTAINLPPGRECCLLKIQVKNCASTAFSLQPELEDGGVIEPILCAPRFTTCFGVFMERKWIENAALEEIPVDNTKQYVRVRNRDILSSQEMLAKKLIYNFKWSLQKSVQLCWSSISNEKGRLSLADAHLSFDSVKRMMPSPINIDISASGVQVDQSRPFNPRVTVTVGQFLDIDVAMVNQTASVLHEKVFALDLEDELSAEHGESVVWAGSLDYLALSVEPGASFDQTFRVLFLVAGKYRFRAKCVNDQELTTYSISPTLTVLVTA